MVQGHQHSHRRFAQEYQHDAVSHNQGTPLTIAPTKLILHLCLPKPQITHRLPWKFNNLITSTKQAGDHCDVNRHCYLPIHVTRESFGRVLEVNRASQAPCGFGVVFGLLAAFKALWETTSPCYCDCDVSGVPWKKRELGCYFFIIEAKKFVGA